MRRAVGKRFRVHHQKHQYHLVDIRFAAAVFEHQYQHKKIENFVLHIASLLARNYYYAKNVDPVTDVFSL